LLTCTYLTPADFPYSFKHPINSGSLPAVSTTCLLEDHQGHIWIGSEKGLYRLDGQIYNHIFSIPGKCSDTSITALCQDDDQNIWIGTPGSGLYRLDPTSRTYTCFQFDQTDEESISSNRISHIYLDPNHRLWISTMDAGLCQFHFQTGKFLRYTPQSPPSRRLPTLKTGPIVADKNGNLFVGSQSQGVYCLPVNKQEFVTLPTNNDSLIKILSVSSLFVDTRDTLWIGTRERGLYQLGGPWSPDKQIKFIPLTAQYFQPSGFRWEINALHESPLTPNQIWIGSNNGLFLFDRDTGQTQHAFHSHHTDSLNGNRILSLMEDTGGILWLGIASGKFDRVDLLTQFFKIHKAIPATSSLSQNHLLSICRISQNPLQLLLGGDDGTLTIANINSDNQLSFRPVNKALPSGIIQLVQLQEDSEKIVILTKDQRLWLYTAGTDTIIPLKPQGLSALPNCISNAPYSGAIIIGGTDGLYLYYPEIKPQTDIESFPNCSGLCVTLTQNDTQGGYYLVTDQGMFHLTSLDPQNKPIKLSYIPKPSDSAPQNQSSDDLLTGISSIICRNNGDVVLGSHHGGLLKINNDKIEPIHIPLPIQPPSAPISGIFEDDLLQLWICTHEGLYMLSSTAKAYDEWTFFGEHKQIPLPLTGAGFIDSPHGQFYLTSAQGLLQINLKDIIYPNPSQTTLINILAIDQKQNRQITLISNETTPIQVPANFNTLELSFRVHDYYSPEKIRVSHRLFGRDLDWRLTAEGVNKIRYQRLAPGSYTLYVNGLNSHRQRGSNGLIFYFNFYIPLLKRPLFWVLTALAALLGIFLFFWLFRRLRLTSQPLEQKIHPVSPTNMNQWASKHNMSEREIEIINLVLAGKSNKDIEEALFISIKTVKSHIYNIYKKANVKSRFELITLFTHNDNNRIEKE